MTYSYVLGGLHIRSELPLGGAGESTVPGEPDVTIEEAAVPRALESPTHRGPLYELDPDRFLLAIDGLARVLVEDGTRVEVERAEGTEDRDLAVLLLGPAFGALCQQRRLLALHASAVRVDGAAVGFTGTSGAGKSTLAWALTEAGHPLVSDDLCIVRPDTEGRIELHPFAPRLKLWGHALRGRGEEPGGYDQARRGLDKYWMPVDDPTAFDPTPTILDRLYLLAGLGRPHDEQIVPVRGLEAMGIVANHSYRRRYFAEAGLALDHLRLCERVADELSVYRLNRPIGLDHLRDTVAVLESHWEEQS